MRWLSLSSTRLMLKLPPYLLSLLIIGGRTSKLRALPNRPSTPALLGVVDGLTDLIHHVFLAHHPVAFHLFGPLLFVFLERFEVLRRHDQRVLRAFDSFFGFAHRL